MTLRKIISGAQTGADISGLRAAKANNLEVGGSIPKGFRTQNGPKPEYAVQYNMTEHTSEAYPPRTFENVKNADGTLRIAVNMNSSGERCTFKAIQQYKKPHFDVYVRNIDTFSLLPEMHPEACAKWITEHNIQVLNVAGNSESTAPGMEVFAQRYVDAVIKILKQKEGI